MAMKTKRLNKIVPGAEQVLRIARPESVVLLAETVRAALEVRDERIDPIKERVSTTGGYSIPSKDLAARVLKGL
jgi:hypothetical protein